MITLTFEPNLEHQSHAINAVVDIFRGQPSQLDTGAALDNFALAQPIDVSGSQAVISQQISSQAIANQRIISDEQATDISKLGGFGGKRRRRNPLVRINRTRGFFRFCRKKNLTFS